VRERESTFEVAPKPTAPLQPLIAKMRIASYRQLSTPQTVDLFDIYQVLQEIMARINSLVCAEELYAEGNGRLFAEAYNNFVKITGWFGGELRSTMQGQKDILRARS